MAPNRTKIGKDGGFGEDDNAAPQGRYFIDPVAANERHRSLATLVASRRCYACRQGDEPPVVDSDARQYIEQIVQHCRETSDYLLQDTPLIEAIFRVLLAGNNRPQTPEEISRELSEKWSLTAYPRDVSHEVIRRLLDHSRSYCIVREPDPEPGETAEDIETA